MPISRGGDRDITLTDPVTLKFNLLNSNKTGDQDLPCTIRLPSLVTISRVVFVLERTHTHAHRPTYIHPHKYRAAKRPTHTGDYVGVNNYYI